MATPNQKKDWQKRLSKIQGFEQAVSDSKSLGGALPAGSYIAKITSAELTESQNGRPQIAIKGEVIGDEEQEGTEFMTFPGLEGVSLKFTLRILTQLGYEIEGDDPSQIIEIVEELNSSEKEVKIKSDGNFINIIGSNEESTDEDNNDEEDEEAVSENDSESDSQDEEEIEEDDKDEEDEEEESVDSKEISEGDNVSWKEGKVLKTGEVLEILEDKNLARIEASDSHKILRIDISKLTLSEKEEEEEENDEEEQEDIEDVKEVTKKSSKVKKSSVKPVKVVKKRK